MKTTDNTVPEIPVHPGMLIYDHLCECEGIVVATAKNGVSYRMTKTDTPNDPEIGDLMFCDWEDCIAARAAEPKPSPRAMPDPPRGSIPDPPREPSDEDVFTEKLLREWDECLEEVIVDRAVRRLREQIPEYIPLHALIEAALRTWDETTGEYRSKMLRDVIGLGEYDMKTNALFDDGDDALAAIAEEMRDKP